MKTNCIACAFAFLYLSRHCINSRCVKLAGIGTIQNRMGMCGNNPQCIAGCVTSLHGGGMACCAGKGSYWGTKLLTENEISRLDVSSALSCREQIYATFHNAEMFQEVVGGGRERVCIPETDSWCPAEGEACLSPHPRWCLVGAEQLAGNSCLRKQR